MKTLKEIKQEVAEENNCLDWNDLILTFHTGDHESFYDKVAIRYANQKLEEAISKSFIYSEGTFDEKTLEFKTVDYEAVNKQSILSLKDEI